jgi:hypothetical protein
MLGFTKSQFFFVLSILLIGGFSGFILKSEIFKDKCPTCPPQTVLQINNEKIKTKGNSSLDLKSIIKDNNILNQIDSLQRKDSVETIKQKKKGFRLFGKKIF